MKYWLLLFMALIVVIVPCGSVMGSTLQDYYNVGDDGGPNIGTPERWFSQTVTASATYLTAEVKVKLYRVGSPGTLYLCLYATSSGKPTGSVLAQDTIDGNSITTSSTGEWYSFDISYTVSSGVVYALVLKAPGADTSNRPVWRYDSTSPTYSGGSMVYSLDSGSSWTIDTAKDFMFEVYASSGPVSGVTSFSITRVSEYDTHLQWVRSANATAVRIIRHYSGFRDDVDDDYLVYDGSASQYDDEGCPYILPFYYSVWEYNTEYWQEIPDYFYIGGETLEVAFQLDADLLQYVLLVIAILAVLVNVLVKSAAVSVVVIVISAGAMVSSINSDAPSAWVQIACAVLMMGGVIGGWKYGVSRQ